MYFRDNREQNIVDKFKKLSKIGVPLECFTKVFSYRIAALNKFLKSVLKKDSTISVSLEYSCFRKFKHSSSYNTLQRI